ncbi:uncharacterized protein [Amphiura filiformis]|uniref:uncharacterized protein n=1 Tax=Amphiura filiformis TaxID=82378 RepID=UPI003B222B83
MANIFHHFCKLCQPLRFSIYHSVISIVIRFFSLELSLRDISTQSGRDYTPPASLSLNFVQDETTKDVSIDINSDASEEDPETLELSIDEVSDKNGVIGKPCTTVVTIHDSSKRRSCIEFAKPVDSVLESSSEVSVTLWRSGNVMDATQIGLTTADVDAKSRQDYNALQNYPISFGSGQTSVTVPIVIVNDENKETDECFQLSLNKLSNAVDNVDICSKDATVFIKDDDDQFYFEGIFARVEEGQCTEVKILRCGYLDKATSVRVTAEPSTPGPSSADTSDYAIQGISPAIQFENNEDSHTLRVCATDDSLYEKDEKFSLVLQPNDGINNNGQIRFPDRVTVVIVSNDLEGISCDPVCVNGVCAEGNNCVCQTGYAGYRCQTQITCSSLQLANGNVPLKNIHGVGSQVTCSCKSGYRLVGMSTLTCNLVTDNYAIWSPQPPICIEEHEEDNAGLIGIILGGIALTGVIVGLFLAAFFCFRNVINPPKGILQPQPQLQLMPYNGVNPYPFTGDAQRVPQPLMF